MKKIIFSAGFTGIGSLDSYMYVPSSFTEDDIINEIKNITKFRINWKEDKTYISQEKKFTEKLTEELGREPEIKEVIDAIEEELLKRGEQVGKDKNTETITEN